MKTIKWRLVTLYVFLVVIVMIVSGTYIIFNIRQDAYQKTHSDLKFTANRIMDAVSLTEEQTVSDLESEVINAIKQNLEKFGLANKRIYLIKDNGDVIPVGNQPLSEAGKSSRAIITAFNGAETETLITSTAYDEVSNKMISMGDFAMPIKDGDKVIFALYIRQSLESVSEQLSKSIFIIVVAALFAIVLSGLLGYFFASSITNPIIALTGKANRIAKGQLDIIDFEEVDSLDEIGVLSESFNYMAKELKKNLSQISSEKNKLETVFTHMADGIIVFNQEGEVIHTNPTAFYLLGEEIGNKKFEELFYEYLGEIDFNQLIRSKKNDLNTLSIGIANKYINVCFANYFNKDDESIGVITVLQDITEQKKLEEMQKEFVANVSHELRTPIGIIKNYTETIMDGAIDEREIAMNFLNVINNESDRMTTLVQDLLELSRMDNKQLKFNFKPMNITEMVMGSVERLKIESEKKNQDMRYVGLEDNLCVFGDINRLEQVLKNIISNAIKYSPDKAEICIDMYKKDNNVVIEVKDSGMGIPEEDLPRIFDRFYRVDKARSRAMGGTGLGLAIAKEIMEAHKGDLYASSIYGKGSKFYIELPIQSVN